jgi:hypothetical protein
MNIQVLKPGVEVKFGTDLWFIFVNAKKLYVSTGIEKK